MEPLEFAAQTKLERLQGLSDRTRLQQFLEISDHWTAPALSQRVVLSDFAEKVLKNGVAVIAANVCDVDVGLAAFYCNDQVKRRAFLTHLAVAPESRGRGLGTALLNYAKAYSESLGMTSMLLEVYNSNENARRLYIASGFLETKLDPGNGRSEHSLYMLCALGKHPKQP